MIMDDKNLNTRKIVLGLKSKRANDEKAVKDNNSWNSPEVNPNGSNLKQSKANFENETNDSSQTPGELKNPGSRTKGSTIALSPRILRSRSQEKPEVQEPVGAPLQHTKSKEKKRKKIKKAQNDHNNEFSKIKSHLKYLLKRKKYEQNFIDAYAGEGWKGQSLEKLRPEKELERAKSDIHRYKVKIRDLFKQIDESCEEGRIPESLYDSEGEIDSEDIFCAKCGLREVRLDNDIILCDGACERGFHQYCLDPPLLKEQVPPGDEGWLCPACDCKADCVYLLNDYIGMDLSIEDRWEKVFPEAAANGDKLDDNLGLPSDDSGDDDYDPDGPQLEDELLGLPSDDSEHDDFNPDRLDSDEEDKNQSSGSDFTSDSEDNSGTKNEVLDEEKSTETNMENDDFAPITAKRNVERLDYKKLHDEAYGNTSSDSSDEDFIDSETPNGQKKTGVKNVKLNKKQKESESTAVEKGSKKLNVEDTSSSPAQNGYSDKSSNRSSYKRISEAATQRLYEAFNENHYPDRHVRENLVKELNLTHTQISKWFENARWKFNHPEGHRKTVKFEKKLVTNEAIAATPKSRKRKTVADHLSKGL